MLVTETITVIHYIINYTLFCCCRDLKRLLHSGMAGLLWSVYTFLFRFQVVSV